jgi:hypothetical protein
MDVKVIKVSGKFVGGVARNDRAIYVSPGYLTEAMALADARCWLAFHGEAQPMPTYTIALDPIDAPGGRRPLGRSVNGKHVTTEYATKAEVWEAVKLTFFAEPVTVLEDGEPVASFYWTQGVDEPVPGKHMVRPVRELNKWGRKGWEPVGVQSVGNGKRREIRTVAK